MAANVETNDTSHNSMKTLDDVMAAFGRNANHRRRTFDLAVKFVPQHITNVFKGRRGRYGSKCNMDITLEGFQKLCTMLRAHVQDPSTKGTIYGFIAMGTVDNQTIVKVGKTWNWGKRHYCGLNKPREVLILEDVDDRHTVERELLKTVTRHRLFRLREDLGKEWFAVSPEVPVDTLRKALKTMFRSACE